MSKFNLNTVASFLLVASLVMGIIDIPKYLDYLAEDEKELQDWIWVSTEQHGLDVILDSFNGIDTVSVDFGDDSDVITFLPDGYGVGYIVYSEIATDEHAMDYLWVQEARDFVFWVRKYPIKGDDREKTNEYYREILNKYVYGEFDAAENNTSDNPIKNN